MTKKRESELLALAKQERDEMRLATKRISESCSSLSPRFRDKINLANEQLDCLRMHDLMRQIKRKSRSSELAVYTANRMRAAGVRATREQAFRWAANGWRIGPEGKKVRTRN